MRNLPYGTPRRVAAFRVAYPDCSDPETAGAVLSTAARQVGEGKGDRVRARFARIPDAMRADLDEHLDTWATPRLDPTNASPGAHREAALVVAQLVRPGGSGPILVDGPERPPRPSEPESSPAMPPSALTPVPDLDVLDHLTRLRSGEPRGPGWRVAVEHGTACYERHFPDRGDPIEALRRAVAWRDETVGSVNASRGQRRRAAREAALGVRIETTRRGQTDYRVAAATLPKHGGHPRRRISRSVDRYGYRGALRQAAEWRFRGMRERYGDDYPYESAAELLDDVLAAEGVPPEGAPHSGRAIP